MQWMVAAFLLLIPLISAHPGRAAEQVDLALVLVTDVSRSIDDSEFDLEKHGYADAFTDPRVLTAIKGGMAGAIAVNYIEFAGSHEVKTVVDWTVIRDEASGRAFVSKLLAAPRSRSFWGHTSISAGIELAMKNLASSDSEATRRIIDVCGDGTNNAGAEVTVSGILVVDRHQIAVRIFDSAVTVRKYGIEPIFLERSTQRVL
jgi:hypothetical protein